MKFTSFVSLFTCFFLLLVAVACTPREVSPPSEDAILWEAWRIIKDVHVEGQTLDAEAVVSGVIGGMLEFGEKPTYPFLTELGQSKTRSPRIVPSELDDLWKAWKLFTSKWPEVDPNLLAEISLHNMVDSLGEPVSVYLSPESFDRTRVETSGESYEGIGAVIGVEDGQLTVMSPMSGSPAEKAGLRQGDIILGINGTPPVGETLTEAVEEIKGEAGTRVTFMIQRPTEAEPREISLTRAMIEVSSVDMSLLPGAVGYLHVQKIRDSTLDELLEHLETFNRIETLAIILDLRNTADGSLDASRRIASQFMSEGLFMSMEDSQATVTEFFIEEGGVTSEGMDMVVLINGATAGPAEALSGALKDSGRAVLLGDRTNGRGITTVYKELSNKGALELPTSYWYRPSGIAIGREGVEPDVKVELSEEDLIMGRDTQFRKAYDYLDERLPAFR